MNMGMHEDLVAEIISYLPLKQLVQCKTLNKKLNHLLSDPKFVQSHALPPILTLLYSSGRSSEICRFLHSSNGLLLLSFEGLATFCVFNPITGATQLIPYPFEPNGGIIRMFDAALACDYPTQDQYNLIMVQELREPKGCYQFHMISSTDTAWQQPYQLTTKGLNFSKLCRPAYLYDSLYWLMEDGRVLGFDTKKKDTTLLNNSLEVIKRNDGENIRSVWLWVDKEQLQLIYSLRKKSSTVIVAYDFSINNWKVVANICWPFIHVMPIRLVNERFVFLIGLLKEEVLYQYDLQTKRYERIHVIPSMNLIKCCGSFVPTLAKVGRDTTSFSAETMRNIKVALEKFKLLSWNEKV